MFLLLLLLFNKPQALGRDFIHFNTSASNQTRLFGDRITALGKSCLTPNLHSVDRLKPVN